MKSRVFVVLLLFLAGLLFGEGLSEKVVPAPGLPGFKVSKDEFKDTTHFLPIEGYTVYSLQNGYRTTMGPMSLYLRPQVQVKGSDLDHITDVAVFLNFEYHNKNWLFMERIVFMNDEGQRITLYFEPSSARRDVKTSSGNPVLNTSGSVSIVEKESILVGLPLRYSIGTRVALYRRSSFYRHAFSVPVLYDLLKGTNVMARLYGRNGYYTYFIDGSCLKLLLDSFEYYLNFYSDSQEGQEDLSADQFKSVNPTSEDDRLSSEVMEDVS
ncbi:MAG: hypothetical protein LBQ93_02325 [Treponema sp.]|jgi:hypothetical protein|nr:hypothetical protein [Treponema sp.]